MTGFDALQYAASQERESVRTSFDLASATDPGTFAEAQTLAQQLGEDVGLVSKDVKSARERLQRRQAASPEFRQQFPLLADKLQDVKFLSMTRDDMGNLQATEGALDWVTRSWRVARGTSRRGTIGTKALLAGRGLTGHEKREIDRIDEQAQAHSERDAGFTGAAIELVGSMVDTAGSALAAGLATSVAGAPFAAPYTAGAAGLAEGMRLEGGNLYADLLAKGYTPAEAAPLAGIFGAAIGAVDLVGLKFAAKPFKETAQAVLPKVFARGLTQDTRTEAFKQALKGYGAALAVEPTTEAIQEVLQMVAHDVARVSYTDDSDSDFDIAQAGHAFTHTLKGMVVLGGLGAGGHYVSDLRKAADAKHTARVFQKMADVEKDSKHSQRDPEGRADFINEKVEGTPAETVYVRGDKAAEVLQQMEQAELEATGQSNVLEQLEQSMPGLAAQIAEADEAGGDVAISNGDFQAKLSLTDVGRAFMEHATFAADGMTVAEAKMFDAMKDAEVEHYREQSAENMARDKALADSAREVEDIVYEQLKATGVMAAKDSRASAQFYRDFVVTQAADMNITPREFYDRYPLRVARGAAKEQASAFNQFAGAKAKGAPRTAMRRALQMQEQGSDAAEVFEATGWSVGADGYLRWELSDDASSLKVDSVGSIGVGTKLGDIIDHRALFKAYPKLAETLVVVDSSMGRGAGYRRGQPRGMFSRFPGTIYLGDGVDDSQLLSAVLHEVQHAIQFEEGFAEGGAPVDGVTTDDYRRIAGEVEARNTQARQALTKRERRAIAPSATEDTSRDAQTVILGGRALDVAMFDQGQRTTDTPEFREWFGDSKVVDESGAPLVVYHGTTDVREVVARRGKSGDTLAVEHLKGVAAQMGLPTNRWPDVATMLEQWQRNGLLGELAPWATSDDIDVAREARESSKGSPDESRTEMGFQVFRLPSEGKELGVHAGTQQQAETFGDAFPFFLSIQTPLRLPDLGTWDYQSVMREARAAGVDISEDEYTRVFEAVDNNAELRDLLRAKGYDGVVYENEAEGAGDSYVVLDPTQIKSVNNRGTFDPADPNILRQDEEVEGQAPRGEFLPESLTVMLGEKADASTFLHESAHYFLTVYSDLAAQPDAPARVVLDMDKLLESFGVEDIAAWNAMTLEQQKEHHEAFAYNFELYLFDGKAPSADLIPLYQRFAAWVRRVYRGIRDNINAIYRREFGKDLPILTGEVRDVMDRMLASEEQIGQAQHVRSMVPMFQTQEESGMSDAAWEEYQTNAGKADDEAIDDMTQKSLADMRWLSNARSRVLKEKQAEHKDTREAVRAEERQRVENLPVYRAMTWLRRGEETDAEGNVVKVEGPHKLDNETVQKILRIAKPPKPKRKGKSLASFVRDKGGISHSSWSTTFPGETSGEFRIKGVFRGKPGKSIRSFGGTVGMPWEMMAEEARAAGYGPQADVGATENLDTTWFVDALADAANGVHTYTTQGRENEGDAGVGVTQEVDPEADDFRAEVFRKLGFGRGGLLQNDGIHPDRVAESFGFTSGEALIDALLAAPKMGVAIDEATDARMLAEHSDMTDPDMVRLAVEEAVHNEARAKFVTTELKALARVTQPTRVMLAAAKEAARQILAGKTISEIRPRDFSIAEARAGRAAFRAIQDGDTAEAIRQKQNQLLQNQLAKQAAEARREVEKTNKDFRRVFKPDAKLAKTRDVNIVQAARAVLSLYDLGQAAKTPLEHIKPVAEHDPEAWAELQDSVARAVEHSQKVEGPAKWKALTLEEYRDLREVIDGLWHKSRRTKQVLLDGKRQDRNSVVARAAEQLDEGLPALPEVTESETALQAAANRVRSWIASATRVEAFMLTLDGGKPGVMTSLFRRVKEAGDNYRKDAIEAIDAYDKLMTDHDFGPNVKIDASEDLGHVFRNKSELLGALRHTGNESNKAKLLVKKGWGNLREDGTLDSAPWDAFVQKMIDKGTLTKADFDLMQAIWDLNEAQKPAIQKAHYANYGFHMREVEAQSFTNQFGTYRGGYVPARADTKLEPQAARQEIDSLAETQKALPVTPRGFTKSRQEGFSRHLSMDLSDGGMHLAQVLRFVHMQEAVNDVKRVLRTPEVEGRLMRHNPAVFSQILDPWLAHSALQSVGEHAKNETEKAIGMLSRSANSGIMFANVSNSLQNLTGWFTAATRVKPRHLLSAVGSYAFGGRSQMTKDVAELSTMMANRLGRQMFEVQQQIRAQATQRGAVGKAVDWVRQNTYFLQRITQNVVDVTTWQASYNQGLTEGLDQQEAIRRADSAVRMTQMATDADDISNWEHGGPIQKAIFPFQNWFIGWANNNASAFKGADTVGARLGVYVYGVMLPMVAAELIAQTVNGRLEDDDEDGWGDEMGDLFWRSQLSGTLAAMPGFGRVGQLVANRFLDDEVWNDRMPAPPFVSALTRGVDALADIKDGKGTARGVEDLTTFFGNLSGLPLGTIARIASYQVRTASGDVEPEGPFGETFDFLRGSLTGRAGVAGR